MTLPIKVSLHTAPKVKLREEDWSEGEKTFSYRKPPKIGMLILFAARVHGLERHSQGEVLWDLTRILPN